MASTKCDETKKTLDYSIAKFKEAELGNKELSYKKKTDVLIAIKKAYQDMTPRTIKGHTPKIKEDCCKEFQEEFNRIIGEGDSFDTMHKKMCDSFLNLLNGKLKENGLAKQKFGKAQKFVNMTFKYLYCFKDNDELKNLFEKAHMPLDSFTLSWYEGETGEHYVWSNLEENDYEHIKKTIETKLTSGKSYKGISLPPQPLKAEFIIWPEEKRKQQLIELNNLLKKLKEDKLFCNSIDATELMPTITNLGEIVVQQLEIWNRND